MREIIVFLESNSNGAGLMFFKQAPALGLRPILFSVNPAWYGFLAEFESVTLPEMTESAVIAAIDRLGRDRVAGVWSAADDGMKMAARVSRTLGWPGADPDAVAVCFDKLETRRALADAGILDVAFARARTGAEAEAAARAIGGAVVIKPRTASGSRGVRLCESPGAARRYFETLFRETPEVGEEGVVVEAFIDGPQFSVEIFDAQPIGVTRKHYGNGPVFICRGTDVPPQEDARVCEEIAAHGARATAAAGHRRGPAHTEVRYGENGPCIIEINPRLAGGMVSQNLRLATGVDLIEASLRFACGMPYDLSRRRDKASATRYLIRQGPPIARLTGLDAAAGAPGVVAAGFFPDRFLRRGPASDYRDRVAYVTAEADSASEAARIAEAGLGELRIVPVAATERARRAARQLLDLIARGLAKPTPLSNFSAAPALPAASGSAKHNTAAIRDFLRGIPALKRLNRVYWRARSQALERLPLGLRRIVRFYDVLGYVPNIYNPRTFNEKILYKFRRDRRDFIKITMDKYLSRRYVQEKLGPAISFSTLHGVYDDARGIAPRDLPEEFIMKASYASGWMKIFRRGDPRPIDEVRALAQSWLDKRYPKEVEEWCCASSRQRILIEELLLQDGGIPHDYKFHCINGNPRVVEVIVDRFAKYEISYFDMCWNKIDGRCAGRPNISRGIDKPRNFDAMCEIARRLSSVTDFLRVDLYNIDGKIYFGELTSFPGHGLDRFSLDEELGKLWKLPARYV